MSFIFIFSAARRTLHEITMLKFGHDSVHVYFSVFFFHFYHQKAVCAIVHSNEAVRFFLFTSGGHSHMREAWTLCSTWIHR